MTIELGLTPDSRWDDRFASSLLDRGWAGLVSVEVLSAELRQLPVSEFARWAYQSTARYWR